MLTHLASLRSALQAWCGHRGSGTDFGAWCAPQGPGSVGSACPRLRFMPEGPTSGRLQRWLSTSNRIAACRRQSPSGCEFLLARWVLRVMDIHDARDKSRSLGLSPSSNISSHWNSTVFFEGRGRAGMLGLHFVPAVIHVGVHNRASEILANALASDFSTG